MIRAATRSDISNLLAIENASFQHDRISQANFMHLLTKANSITLIDEHDEHNQQLRGYITLLFRSNSLQARIYSIATTPQFLGQGVAASLLLAAEHVALMKHCDAIQLEIRKDNRSSLHLFQTRDYRIFSEYPTYYQDGMDAYRLRKTLTAKQNTLPVRVPYYQQTLGFTCGPACLMMVMKAFTPAFTLNRIVELQLWREATTIFMASGHGGCGPHGLALAAKKRGYPCEIFVNGTKVLLQDSVRSEEKREVIHLVQDDFLAQVKAQQIPLHFKLAGAAELERSLLAGGIPLVLISLFRLTKERVPHWVVIAGFDEHYFYIHDPDNSNHRRDEDRINMAIHKKDFEKMARFGRQGNQAAVLIYPRRSLVTGSIASHS